MSECISGGGPFNDWMRHEGTEKGIPGYRVAG